MEKTMRSCPTCKQYSATLNDDQVAKAYMHFESMCSHRGDGIPTQFNFDQTTRDAAKVLLFAIDDLRNSRNQTLD
jgi:hypothetical protein